MKLLALLGVCFASTVMGQAITVLNKVPPGDGGEVHVPGPRPQRGTLARVDPAELARTLGNAPLERAGEDLTQYGLAIDLPHPDGGLWPCFVAASSVMEPGLAAKFPEFRTFIVRSIDRRAGGRIELTPRGLTGMLRATRADGTGGAWMIDLWQSADPSLVISYWLRDLPNSVDWACETAGVADAGEATYAPRVIRTVSTLRLAMACTGEYAVHHSTLAGHAPNVADPMAAIITVVSRINVVYENDVAVHFNLVANNDQLIFVDPETDPYDATCSGGGGADCSGNLLAPNQATLDGIIGPDNYDVGHLLTRVFGGVANLRAVCNPTIKARGISGIPRGGDIDPLSALVPIHELGHQFGANHTFSGVQGRCQGNVNLSTAWEAGSGSSPMAYPGGCPVGDAPPSDNVATFADPWFHAGSLGEMRAFIDGTAFTCPLVSESANNLPVIQSLTANTQAPPATPFTLTASATDPDNDPLTYSWEQFDAGVARPIIDGTDNGQGALFRIFPPVTATSRTFPRWADILSGVPTPGERLPTTTNATRRFRVVVRDNRPGAGGVAVSGNVSVAIRGTGPFALLTPGDGAQVRSGAPAVVTWSVGGTNVSPILCSSVTLRLSTDDGATFPITLGSFPNTGSASVPLPAITQTIPGARLKLEGDGKIFFSVSRPFSLRPACSADFNNDGDVGTDQDIEAFFACIGGHCCPACDPAGADFNADSDVGTDQDIEAYFRALTGGSC